MCSASRPWRLRQREQALEQRARLVAAAERGERVDVPERADDERVLGRAEVVLLDVAEDEVAALQLASRSPRPSRRSADRRQRRKPSSASSSRLASSCVAVRRRATKLSRSAFQQRSLDERADALGLAAPAARALGRVQARRDARQPVARGPAHHARERVHAQACRAAPTSPRRAGRASATRAPPERLEPLEQRGVAALREPLVEEHVRRGEDRRAVDVVLDLPRRRRCRRAPAPCRDSRAARRRSRSSSARVAADAIHRLQRPSVARRGDRRRCSADSRSIVVGRAEPVQRVDDEVAVAQPAVAVVPVAPESGASGIDVVIAAMIAPVSSYAFSLSVIAARITARLPFERDREPAHPVAPVRDRLLDEAAAELVGTALGHGLVGAEQQRDRVARGRTAAPRGSR